MKEKKHNIVYKTTNTIDGNVINYCTYMSAVPFNVGHISQYCHGIRKTHKGFKWKFADTPSQNISKVANA